MRTDDPIGLVLQDAVADEPPLRLDLDALTTRARREQRRRRAVVSAALATVLVVMAVLALPSLRPWAPQAPPPAASSDVWPESPYVPLTAEESGAVSGALVAVTEAVFVESDGEWLVRGDPEIAGGEEVHDANQETETWDVRLGLATEGFVFEASIRLTASSTRLPPLNCREAEYHEQCSGPWMYTNGVIDSGLYTFGGDAPGAASMEMRLSDYQAIEFTVAGNSSVPRPFSANEMQPALADIAYHIVEGEPPPQDAS
ncbi:hypothetical protein [Streptomyces sp. B6B3]|uniref:hypothetical protein n=1 Tax=Streptomyces sp. B6B3 TaxID=3153570 RepID=UPI00325E6858